MKYLTAPETKYILNTMQDGVISVNKTGMVTYINEVAERLVVQLCVFLCYDQDGMGRFVPESPI